ncbi:MAG: protein-L-isoaspartate(D-aspartate) O-methyltransferase [Planctomycetes bacterium]|nr:protein-L-isoaspartate(D-aspartate) O-methyltransferase [Planctomycetota bacterium]
MDEEPTAGGGHIGGVATRPPPREWEARSRMVREQIVARGLKDGRVLAAMLRVPRHRFVPPGLQGLAHEDRPLPIGCGVTISQPFIVSEMTLAAAVGTRDRVLEVGTGSGYQTAVLAEMAAEVWSVEIIEEHHLRAGALLSELGYRNVHLRYADGYRGWPEAAPFDAVVVTAAARYLPGPLLDQLAAGGRMVIPLGGSFRQRLVRLCRTPEGPRREDLGAVLFVPLTCTRQPLRREAAAPVG